MIDYKKPITPEKAQQIIKLLSGMPLIVRDGDNVDTFSKADDTFILEFEVSIQDHESMPTMFVSPSSLTKYIRDAVDSNINGEMGILYDRYVEVVFKEYEKKKFDILNDFWVDLNELPDPEDGMSRIEKIRDTRIAEIKKDVIPEFNLCHTGMSKFKYQNEVEVKLLEFNEYLDDIVNGEHPDLCTTFKEEDIDLARLEIDTYQSMDIGL